jgi:hypothetical protein
LRNRLSPSLLLTGSSKITPLSFGWFQGKTDRGKRETGKATGKCDKSSCYLAGQSIALKNSSGKISFPIINAADKKPVTLETNIAWFWESSATFGKSSATAGESSARRGECSATAGAISARVESTSARLFTPFNSPRMNNQGFSKMHNIKTKRI